MENDFLKNYNGLKNGNATKYHRLIRDYLRQNGVADYQLVDSQGATEGTVKNETAEAVADITSTGETLRANHLRLLDDGPALKSQATLFRAKKAAVSDAERANLNALLEKLSLNPTNRSLIWIIRYFDFSIPTAPCKVEILSSANSLQLL